jgi:hypothetical protein
MLSSGNSFQRRGDPRAGRARSRACASRSWLKIRNKGVIQSCEEWVRGPETDGFRTLVKTNLGGLTTESLVIQHSDWFPPDVVSRAAERVVSHLDGFPGEIVELARHLMAG